MATSNPAQNKGFAIESDADEGRFPATESDPLTTRSILETKGG